MGLLDKLWDDTVAGPRPETGLSKLRKHSTFAFRPSPGKEEAKEGGSGKFEGDEAPRVTRSIMIKRPTGCPSPGNATPPLSPSGSTPPVSPFSGGGREWNRFRRKSSSDAYERGGMAGVGPRNPAPPYEV
ncbi:dormancy-associated protein homolog 3-like [Phoenix dactylifera]|uniref:Dormancy-associated protein homolog 3-like n=1 Tax=Phoenix dactylifera TaxID=42345 RepID=A0A8B7C1R7_PHODC|nr:dormancy-associated protein homolog 3-like [Phoenix dactylifera]